MTAENVRPAPRTRDERTDRYAEAITNSDGDTLGSRAIRAVARAVMAVADAERERDAATIAELRAEVELLRGERNIAVNAAASKIPDFDVQTIAVQVAQREAADRRAEAAEERLRAVEALADEWEQASGLRSGFSSAELERASQSQRTLWEAADDLRAVLAELPDADGRRERLADCLYRWNGSALYGRDLGPFDGDRMESERGRWLEQADAVLSALAPVTSPAEQEGDRG